MDRKVKVEKDRQYPVPRIRVRERDTDGGLTNLDMSSITRMVLTILDGGDNVTIDTDLDADALTWIDAGYVELHIGGIAEVEALDEGEYYARLVGVDGSDDKWQLAHEDDADTAIILNIRDTSTIS